MVAARRLLLVLAMVVAALALPSTASATGGNYAFVGGSQEARTQVRAALEASSFDWDRVPVEVTIRITNCGCAGAKPGEIVLDEDMIVRSPFGPKYAWGIVQHEYAHQLDFFRFGPREHATLLRKLGGEAWCYEVKGLAHDDYGCERFATMIAWAYWPARANVQRPHWSTSLTRADLRAFVDGLLSRPRSVRPAF
ncbi:MAG: hypothetical protein ACRDON_06665 [Gaiellaceae bacterium]